MKQPNPSGGRHSRRLLSTIELLATFLPERDIRKARHALKHHLDTFDRLRDTQVQLTYVGRMTGTLPDAYVFYDWLRDRKTRFTRTNMKNRQTYQDEASKPMSCGI